MRRRSSSAEERKGAPEWMVSYGDMMSLLLCFFILLYSFSSLDAQKFQMVVLSLKGAFGVLDGGRTLENADMLGGSEIMTESTGILELAEMEKTTAAVETALREQGLTGKVSLLSEERGLVVRLMGSALFESGKAALTAEARITLDKVAAVLASLPNKVRIEGHTDSRPIHTLQFPSNWELSTARATTVIRYFVEQHTLNPTLLSAAGYGEYQPVAPNDTPVNMAANRRIDIVILWSFIARQEPGATGDSSNNYWQE